VAIPRKLGEQEVISDDRDIVAAIRARLAERVGRKRYEVWFGRTTQLALCGESLVVSVPSQFFQDWLRSHFRKDLEASSLEAAGRALSLEFRIADEPVDAGAPQAHGSTNGALAPPAPERAAPRERHCAASVPAPACPEPPWRRLATLAEFVVGPSNCVAHKSAEMAVVVPGNYSPLVIHGPTGTGKTHLAEGIYTAFRQARPRARAVLLSAEQFTCQFVDALHKSGMASFRAKYRDLELLVIDDLQFLARKTGTIGELQHTIDTLARRGRQLVFTADRPPAAVVGLSAELVSRLAAGMVCKIEPTEYGTRLGIVRSQAAQLGMNVPEEVQEYIAAQFTTQSRELIGALKRLHATSLAHGRPITPALAEEALVELIVHQGRVVHMSDIDKAVCEVFGLEPESLQSNRKGKAVSRPRALAMYLARKLTRAPLAEIGAYFGRKSHSTVISASKKIEGWMAKQAPLQVANAAVSLEETIRRVEERLRAG
jgi:chromosomal replication initiator protein